MPKFLSLVALVLCLSCAVLAQEPQVEQPPTDMPPMDFPPQGEQPPMDFPPQGEQPPMDFPPQGEQAPMEFPPMDFPPMDMPPQQGGEAPVAAPQSQAAPVAAPQSQAAPVAAPQAQAPVAAPQAAAPMLFLVTGFNGSSCNYTTQFDKTGRAYQSGECKNYYGAMGSGWDGSLRFTVTGQTTFMVQAYEGLNCMGNVLTATGAFGTCQQFGGAPAYVSVIPLANTPSTIYQRAFSDAACNTPLQDNLPLTNNECFNPGQMQAVIAWPLAQAGFVGVSSGCNSNCTYCRSTAPAPTNQCLFSGLAGIYTKFSFAQIPPLPAAPQAAAPTAGAAPSVAAAPKVNTPVRAPSTGSSVVVALSFVLAACLAALLF